MTQTTNQFTLSQSHDSNNQSDLCMDAAILYLCRSEEANGIEMFHCLSSAVGDDLKEIHFLLEDLGLRVHHTHNTDLGEGNSNTPGNKTSLTRLQTKLQLSCTRALVDWRHRAKALGRI